ncbi:unnamed protein product [Protopolystoma xenopodis]|uniref:Uncharacterized protein n=1 Tax=Protopolystoma xenopodis TaxID=117903 RepID=A0A3S4ZTK8_9PLAT|nr:unnamed protein product [Protopolystoma xenopodis]
MCYPSCDDCQTRDSKIGPTRQLVLSRWARSPDRDRGHPSSCCPISKMEVSFCFMGDVSKESDSVQSQPSIMTNMRCIQHTSSMVMKDW